MYHIVLRTGALTLALLLVFDSGILSPVTARLSQDTQLYLAQSVGMMASVQPTELNQYTAELTARDRVLTQREAEIAAREIEVGIVERDGLSSDYSTYIISLLLFIILVLIVMNYALDYLRASEQAVRRIRRIPKGG